MTMTVTANILRRTFRIRYNGNTGTCFTIDFQGRRYLVTARHIVDSIRNDTFVNISHKREWLSLRVQLVGHGAGNIDVTVLAPRQLFGQSYPLKTTTAGLVLAEDIYFLGFPYGLSINVETTLNDGFPLPLVKKAVVSAFESGDGPFLLDGHNNPGFSGGPVTRRGTTEEQTVIGVVSGYQYDRHKVRDEHGDETMYTYDTNTGIIVAHDIGHALAIIEKNPIGIPVV